MLNNLAQNLDTYILFCVVLPIYSAAMVHWVIVPGEREQFSWPVALYVFCIPLYLAPIWSLLFFF